MNFIANNCFSVVVHMTKNLKLSLKTKSPQVTVQNIPAENTDVTSLPTQ